MHSQGECREVTINGAIEFECGEAPTAVFKAEVLSQTGNRAGDVVRYICVPGFYPFPPQKLFFHTCMPDGAWSSAFLQCLPTLCAHITPPSVSNAEFTGFKNDNEVTALVHGVYNCTVGYTVDGNPPNADRSNTVPATVACDIDKGWLLPTTSPLPGCSPVACGKVTYPSQFQAVSHFDPETPGKNEIEIPCT